MNWSQNVSITILSADLVMKLISKSRQVHCISSLHCTSH